MPTVCSSSRAMVNTFLLPLVTIHYVNAVSAQLCMKRDRNSLKRCSMPPFILPATSTMIAQRENDLPYSSITFSTPFPYNSQSIAFLCDSLYDTWNSSSRSSLLPSLLLSKKKLFIHSSDIYRASFSHLSRIPLRYWFSLCFELHLREWSSSRFKP